ncbi:hypothetical protein CU098_005738 [Rhizopus stolonifer]|uniref:Swiss Army Knife RNA repair protein HAD domain-containing protein n=1 Tax=Rhizopus stolonifer TaxID=4846 RepID=A0A367ITU4_RHIST|nr:hypothetical protein CU098_005738 [Rhizopus stolonifer]
MMITSYNKIRDAERGVLQRQFKKSSFFLSKQHRQPTKLAIFDFDSTLFFSPLLSPTIWHPSLIRVATSESVYGPGWWRDIRSLDLGPTQELEKTAWKGFWNEKIVAEARACIEDSDTMTIVLTGRRYHPFHHLIPLMLSSKGLEFDVIGLRPDPERVSEDYDWQVNHGGSVCYNLSGSVFQSTMHFKTCFILNILHNVPSLKQVTMWDDRLPHVKRFKEYLGGLVKTGLIQKGHVIYVPGIRPKYNPVWEKRVIGHIIETHNKALLAHRQDGLKRGKIEQRIPTWPHSEDPLDTSQKPLQLFPLPAATIVRLSSTCTQQLKQTYLPLFKQQQQHRSNGGGEELEFFGDAVYVSSEALDNNSIPVGNIGDQVQVAIKAYSNTPHHFSLRVKIKTMTYMLPLWFKPSEYNDILHDRNAHWITTQGNTITGQIDYVYRLGVVEKKAEKRSATEDSLRPSVRPKP